MTDGQHPTWRIEIRETPNNTWFAVVRNTDGKLVFLTPAHATRADLLHSLDAFATWMYQIDGDWEHCFVEVSADAEPGNSGREI